ncbi:MAG: hypothetical protein IJ422_04675 [Oscillospiraceae bacterium]|nr:hypothetical protein [Oscillospiraceae bacterium]
MENKEGFSFTYSAAQQQEVEDIRKKYLPKEEDKMEQLRKLHAIPTQKAQAASLAVGIIGALIMGTGMSLAMTDIGEMLGSHRELSMLIGILIGLVGMVLVASAYPLYNRVLKKQREKIAPEILRLTDELMK